MELYAVRVFVTDWGAARRFYGEVLGLPERFADAGHGWAEFDLGGPALGLERVDSADPETTALVGRFLGVSVRVDDVERAYRQLREAGVSFRGPPERQPWGGVLAHLEDPEGNVLTLLGSR